MGDRTLRLDRRYTILDAQSTLGAMRAWTSQDFEVVLVRGGRRSLCP